MNNYLGMKSFYWILSLLLACIYLVLALIKIEFPGIFYDEIAFGNAALGGIDHYFLHYRMGNFPVLLMTYMGALKAYIYYPIFKIFGVSVYSIRIPTIIISALALYLLVIAVRDFFNWKIALTTLTLIAIDASFINQTRYDNGPTVI
jgi:hypothetical protein